MEDNGQADAAPTAKARHRRSMSSLSLSALFHGHLHRRHDPAEASSPESSPKGNHSRWMRSKHHNDHHHAAEIKGKCRNLISRKGHHRRHASDLTYDPHSYAQNFESEEIGDDNESLLLNSFTARLKAGEEGEGGLRLPPQRKAAEKGEEKEGPAAKEGKKARRKSFDLNELMNVAKSLEDEEPI